MSEPIPGITFTPPPAAVRHAAVVVLVREGADGREVLWVKRGDTVAFSRGFHAFPGGSVEPSDAATAVPGVAAERAQLYACAVRETFEEVGIRLDPARLVPAGQWVTPSFSPIRFDARFFLAVVPPDTNATIASGELVEGSWVRPAAALARWEDGSALLHPPNLHVMATLAGLPPEAAIARLRRPPHVDAHHVAQRIEFQRGILFLPLRTPTLPPATHTNCYLVGTGEMAIVDPGSPHADEQDRLESAVRELLDEGRKVKAVLLTHHHPDHTGGACEIGRRLGITVLASAETARRVPGVDGRLEDGDIIDLDGPRPMRLRCILTEGHARGHLCFMDEASHAVLAGDMVAGGSTIVIDPPEGDMGVYIESLQRLLREGTRTLYPAHGIPMPDGPEVLADFVEHREMRMQQIALALRDGIGDIAAIVARVYADTPAYLHPAAERSARASLLLLVRRGVAREERGRFAISAP